MTYAGKRIALGMSGGVDSSAAALVLREDGWEVIGVTCAFLPGDVEGQAVSDAREACDRLGIRHVVRDCSLEFERRVIAPFVEAYAAGLTPSPCVGCNAFAKIPFLLEAADALGCTHVATGHYARVVKVPSDHTRLDERFAIACAEDTAKDQSYMLALLSQEQLARLVLPLGALTKARVRQIAQEAGLSRLACKAESQDICFAPQGYRDLLAARGLSCKPGPIMLGETVVGRHTGLADYTMGQRKGIGVAGPEPYYVTGKDVAENALIIGTAKQARIERVAVGQINWQALADPGDFLEAEVKLRYRSGACPCIIVPGEKSRALVHLAQPQTATAPGQYAVFYQGAIVLGGGVIEEVSA